MLDKMTVCVIVIARDMALFFFQPKRTDIFSYFSLKTYVVGTHYKCL